VSVRRDRAATLVVAAMAVVIGACSSTSGAPPDGAPGGSGGGMGGAGGTGGVTTCDPAAQNCSSDVAKCDFTCAGTGAVLACIQNTDGGAPGSPCSFTTPCPRGTGCLSAADAGVVCRKYCAGDGDCATGERCHNATVSISCSGTSTPIALHFCY